MNNKNDIIGKISYLNKENINKGMINNEEIQINKGNYDVLNSEKFDDYSDRKNLISDKLINSKNHSLNNNYVKRNSNGKHLNSNEYINNINKNDNLISHNNYNNINNINNNSLNFNMNFYDENNNHTKINNNNISLASKLNFPQTIKFNNLLDKEGFKYFMDKKYSKNKTNTNINKGGQTSTKLNTYSNNYINNPNSIVSNKLEKSSMKHDNSDYENKNMKIHNFQNFNENQMYELNFDKNVTSSNYSNNVGKQIHRDKSFKNININSSNRETIEYLKEYEDKLKEHLRKNLKDKFEDDEKVEEILNEMQKFSQKEILKIPVKQVNNSSWLDSAINTLGNNTSQSEINNYNNFTNVKNFQNLDSYKTNNKEENKIFKNLNNFSQIKNDNIHAYKDLSRNRDFNNIHTRNDISKDNFIGNNYNTNSNQYGNNLITPSNKNSKLVNNDKPNITDLNSSGPIENLFDRNKNVKTSVLKLHKNTNYNNVNHPFNQSPKRFNNKNNYENSLFSKFNNFKPRKVKENSEKNFSTNSKKEFNTGSIQMSGLSSAFKTFINSNNYKISNSKHSSNIENKQSYLYKKKPNVINTCSSLNKIKGKFKVFNNSAGKIKTKANKLKSEISIMDKFSDKLKKDFENIKKYKDIYNIRQIHNDYNLKNKLNYSQDFIKRESIKNDFHIKTTIKKDLINEQANNNFLYSETEENDGSKYLNFDRKSKNQKIIFKNFDKLYLSNLLKDNIKNSRNHKDIFILDEMDSNKNEFSNDTQTYHTNKNVTNKTLSNKNDKSKININETVEGKINKNIQNYEKKNNILKQNSYNFTSENDLNFNTKINNTIDNFNCSIGTNNSNFIANNKLFKFIQDIKSESISQERKNSNRDVNKINLQNIINTTSNLNKINDNLSIKNQNYSSRFYKNNNYSNLGGMTKVRSYSPKMTKLVSKNIINFADKLNYPEIRNTYIKKPYMLNLKKKLFSLSNKKDNNIIFDQKSENKNKHYYNSKNLNKKFSSRERNIDKSSIYLVDMYRTNNTNNNGINNKLFNESIEEKKLTLKKDIKGENPKSQDLIQESQIPSNVLDSEEYKIEKKFETKDFKTCSQSINIEKNMVTIDSITYNNLITDMKENLTTEDNEKSPLIDKFNKKSNYQNYKSNKDNLKNHLSNTKYINIKAFSNVENLHKANNKILQKTNTSSIANSGMKNTQKKNDSQEKKVIINNKDIIKKYNLYKGLNKDINERSKSKNKNKTTEIYNNYINAPIKNENIINKNVQKKSINEEKNLNYLDKAKKLNSKSYLNKAADKLNIKENPKNIIDYINSKCLTGINDKGKTKNDNNSNFKQGNFEIFQNNNNLDYDLMNKIINGLDEEYKGLFNFSYENVINKEKSENTSLLSHLVDDL